MAPEALAADLAAAWGFSYYGQLQSVRELKEVVG